jgi:hypothetical protein
MPVTREENDVSTVMIAVDPHKASNTAAVLDPVTKTLIESAWFANTADGFAQLARFAARWEQRRRAVEGCFGAHVQSECQEIWTTWVPGSRRREKDAPDIARLRQALQRATPRAQT